MRIQAVQNNSLGEELGIKAGDVLLSFDEYKVEDILDYEFYNSQEEFSMCVQRGEQRLYFDIEKDEDETLGLSFCTEIEVKKCKNKCIFCFVDQLPSVQLRQTLHVKDDDYRHSFISGTYITLTNLSESDIQRIIRLGLSPLYISVHSTDDEMRKHLLGVKKIQPIMPLLERLHEGGIQFHTQIVYCPTFNEDIYNSINQLSQLALSLAIVPVGLTKASNPILRTPTVQEAKNIISIVKERQKHFYKSMGKSFVYAADELYLAAGEPIPSAQEYDDYCQIENGVGLIAKFCEDFDYALDEYTKNSQQQNINNGGLQNAANQSPIGDISIATGESAYELINEKAQLLASRFGGKITVYKIKNDFFGSSVTVAGLVTGGDILRQLQGKHLGERLVLPSVMLREAGDKFLDDKSVFELAKALAVKIEISPSDGEGFVKTILKVKE